jgi:hypothetical protein
MLSPEHTRAVRYYRDDFLPSLRVALAGVDRSHASLYYEAAKLHETYAGDIMHAVEQAARTGEPVVRHLAYEFPREGWERVNRLANTSLYSSC